MRPQLDPAAVLRKARTGAGLTQRALADAAGTSQSVVARIEGGQTSPTVATLTRLLSAAGFVLESEVSPAPAADTHMLEDVPRILAMTAEERLIEVRNASRLFESVKRV